MELRARIAKENQHNPLLLLRAGVQQRTPSNRAVGDAPTAGKGVTGATGDQADETKENGRKKKKDKEKKVPRTCTRLLMLID